MKYRALLSILSSLFLMLIISNCAGTYEAPIGTSPTSPLISATPNNSEAKSPVGEPPTLPTLSIEEKLDYTSELFRTGEYVTAEQIEVLKTEALSWKSANVGIAGWFNIVVIESSDETKQQVYISVKDFDKYFLTYEKLQIQPPDRTQARIIYASGGGGSGEVSLVYLFVPENGSEWIELFDNGGSLGSLVGQWKNAAWRITPEFIQFILELSPEDHGSFK